MNPILFETNDEPIYLLDVILHQMLFISSRISANIKYLDHQQEACEVLHEPLYQKNQHAEHLQSMLEQLNKRMIICYHKIIVSAIHFCVKMNRNT